MTNSNSRGSGGSGAGFSFMRRIWIILFAIAETLLAARVVLKATGTDASNALVKGIYDVTGEVTRVFEGIIAPSASFPMERNRPPCLPWLPLPWSSGSSSRCSTGVLKLFQMTGAQSDMKGRDHNAGSTSE